MRRIRYTVLTLLVLLAGVLAGCDAVNMPSQAGANASVNIGGNTPKNVAERFLAAWDGENSGAMYELISQRSRDLYDTETFSNFYADVDEKLNLDGIDFTIHNVEMQGTSAALHYDITLNSTIFGEIADEGRMMRLVREGEQWRVAWSTMDIFDRYTSSATLEVASVSQPRENIYDRQGYPLVMQNGEMTVLYARQEAMSDIAACQRLLADLLHQPLQDMQNLFSDYLPDNRFYVGEIDPNVEQENAGRLSSLCGMTRDSADIYTREGRQYIGQGAAVHATGYVGQVPAENSDEWLGRGYSLTDIVGRSGVEYTYQDDLAGQPERVLRVVESGGTTLAELGRTEGAPPRPVYLTIDRDVQLEAARTMAGGYNYAINNWARPNIVEPNNAGAAAVAIDVNTGAIRAMFSYPTYQPGLFDPSNTFATNRGTLLANVFNDNREPLVNRATNRAISSGSVFKIITTAAILNEGLIDPNETFECGLTWDGRERWGDTFSPRLDWRYSDELEATGPVTPSQALTSSCDPFYYEFGAMMYRERSANTLVRYANMMGMGRRTGIDAYGEGVGNIPTPSSVEEAINNSIGQGNTQVTALQTAVMVAAVANGGTLYRPYVVEQIGDGAEYDRAGEPEIIDTLDIDPEVLAVVQQGMCDVTTDMEIGTGRYAFADSSLPPSYSACGKTGTAQAGSFPHAWFVAYAPADNPEIAVVVMAENSREGSEVAAPMARRILDAYFGQPLMPYPEWWEEDYVPLTVPDNSALGGLGEDANTDGDEN